MTSGEGGLRLHLVRHGLPVIRTDVAAHEWRLDPAGFAAIDSLRSSGRIPADAVWFSSPEPKALDTARRLTDAPVTVVDDLREHERGPTPWFEDRAEWRAVVRRAFAQPDAPSLPGWEPLRRTTQRVEAAVRRILDDHPDDEIALAGHGTAWTALVAELTGTGPDLASWDRLEMPDVWVVPLSG